MRFGNYSLQVPQATESGEGYAHLTHGQKFTIKAGNHFHRRVDAAVRVDGKSVGTFRIEPNRTLVLERPENDSGMFTFYRVGSADASQAGESGIAIDDRGLVQVTFMPEKQVGQQQNCSNREKKTSGNILPSMMRSTDRSMTAGVTGLSGQSGQQFSTVSNLDYDHPDTFVTLTLRLVADDNTPRPLLASTNGNLVPKAVS